MTGRWSVVADTFCTIYDGSKTGGCFRVRRVSANCYEIIGRYYNARYQTNIINGAVSGVGVSDLLSKGGA